MRGQNPTPSLSIIIPTLNEASFIERALQHTLQHVSFAWMTEILVVDGGSDDTTVQRAQRWGVSVLHAPRGRAHQMNIGASHAKGELLLFLHADTLLPEGYDVHVRRILLTPGVAAGAFRLHIEPSSPGLRFIETMANWRSQRLHMPYGDQAIFLRASTFHEVGGFPEQPIMEDYELMKRLQKRGRIVIAPTSVTTSARRWQRLGVWRTTALNQAIILGYELGISPERLARWYRRPRNRRSKKSAIDNAKRRVIQSF